MVNILFGVSILAAAAYLLSRRKNNNSVPENNVFKEVELRNLQLQEDSLQFSLEDEPDRIQTKIDRTERTLDNLGRALNAPIIARTFEARRAKDVFRRGITEDISETAAVLESLKLEQIDILDTKNSILETQEQFNSASLFDIRQRLNSSVSL